MSSGLPVRASGVWSTKACTSAGLVARTLALMLVSMKPGPIALTRTPSLPSSTASALVKPSTPCFEVVYAAELGVRRCTKDWIEPILTMRPLLARRGLRNACVVLKTPLRLSEMMSFQSFATVSVSAVKALRRVIPALLTRIETCPTSSATCLASAKQSSRLVTSSAKLAALPPDLRIPLGGFRDRVGVDVEQHHL